MVFRTEAILNLFETKGSREVWLDRFAASNLPIDTFCEMNHIKKETITKALDEKMSSYREQHPPKHPAVINEEIFCGQSGGIKQDSGQHRRNSKNIDGPGRKTKKL